MKLNPIIAIFFLAAAIIASPKVKAEDKTIEELQQDIVELKEEVNRDNLELYLLKLQIEGLKSEKRLLQNLLDIERGTY